MTTTIRGLDISNVSFVVQFSPPQHSATFVHRVGRTARFFFFHSSSFLLLLFLLPFSYITTPKYTYTLQRRRWWNSCPSHEPRRRGIFGVREKNRKKSFFSYIFFLGLFAFFGSSTNSNGRNGEGRTRKEGEVGRDFGEGERKSEERQVSFFFFFFF